MHNKFQCHYRLNVAWTAENGQPMLITVQDPVTIQFNVSKATFQSNNIARIVVTNMDGASREAIYQDRLIFNTEERKMLTLEAGYGEQLAMVCLGWISECYSERQGTDVQTIIEVIDPDILTEYCSVTFEPGTSFDEAYKYLASQMPNLKIGELGNLQGEFKVPTVFDGNTFVALNKLTGEHTFIENGKLHTLNDNETLTDYEAYLIEADTGLLETPKRREAILEIVMLFEPTLRIGQMVEIKSSPGSTGYRFNGQYKILGMTHDCIISSADGGNRKTILQLQYIDFLTNSNVNLTDEPAGASPSKVINNKIEPITTKLSSNVKSIFKQLMKNNGLLVKNAQITNRISWKEMLYPGGTQNKPADVKTQITEVKLGNCETIAIALTDFLNKHFPGKSINITSGYRTNQNNNNQVNSAKKEGTSKGSNHLYGKAIDFTMPGVPISQLHSVFKNSWKLGLGTYSWGLHVSTNPRERFKGKG